jgi:hypothetical protein
MLEWDSAFKTVVTGSEWTSSRYKTKISVFTIGCTGHSWIVNYAFQDSTKLVQKHQVDLLILCILTANTQ